MRLHPILASSISMPPRQRNLERKRPTKTALGEPKRSRRTARLRVRPLLACCTQFALTGDDASRCKAPELTMLADWKRLRRFLDSFYLVNVALLLLYAWPRAWLGAADGTRSYARSHATQLQTVRQE